jgi:hypothetical protein
VANFGDESWSIQPYADAQKLQKMAEKSTKLKDLPISINYGIKTGYNEAFFVDEETRQRLITTDKKSDEIIKPMVRGRDISAYGFTDNEFLINTHNGLKGKNPPLLPIDVNNYPAIKEYLKQFYPKLEKRGDKGETPYNLRNCAYLEEFDKPKIMYPNMTSVFPFLYDETGLLSNDKSFILTAQDETISLLFLTALFNSSLSKLWIWYNCPELQGGTREIRKVFFEHFPVPQASKEQTMDMEQLAIRRAQFTNELQNLSSKFQRAILRNFNLESLSNNLQNWYLLSYPDFVKELRKKKIKLSLAQEAEWEDYFMEESAKAKSIKNQIEQTDNEIDKMVYGLYGVEEE